MSKVHLLWWVFRAIQAHPAGITMDALSNEALWERLDAPAWVLPAMKAAYAEFMLDCAGVDP